MNAAKQYLSRVRALDLKINQLIEERDDLRLIATGNSSPRLDPDRVQTSGGGDVMARQVERYIDLEKKITILIDKYVDEKARIVDEIHALHNPKYIELLYLRYIKYKRLEEIACIMRKTDGAPYSYEHILHMHGDALEEFAKQHSFRI